MIVGVSDNESTGGPEQEGKSGPVMKLFLLLLGLAGLGVGIWLFGRRRREDR